MNKDFALLEESSQADSGEATPLPAGALNRAISAALCRERTECHMAFVSLSLLSACLAKACTYSWSMPLHIKLLGSCTCKAVLLIIS